MDVVDRFGEQWRVERPDLDVLPLEYWGRLKRAAYLLNKALSPTLDHCSLSMAEYEVLAALMRSGPPYQMRPTDLAQSLIVTPGAVTARLGTLERRGLIYRFAAPDDRRVQRVGLTAEGRRRFEPALEHTVERVREILSSMPERDRADLYSSLRALMIALNDTVDELQDAPRDSGEAHSPM